MQSIFTRYLACTIVILLLIQLINVVYFARSLLFTLTYASTTYDVMANE